MSTPTGISRPIFRPVLAVLVRRRIHAPNIIALVSGIHSDTVLAFSWSVNISLTGIVADI